MNPAPMLRWIWQAPNWPTSPGKPTPSPRCCVRSRSPKARCSAARRVPNPSCVLRFTLDALLQNIINSSAIEDESLNVGSVRSSIARRLGVSEAGESAPDARSEGLARIMWEATSALDEPLTEDRLRQWHAWLFAGESA